MLTPSDYKKRYENIELPGRTVAVHVNKYRLASKNANTAARAAFLAALAKRGIDVALRIDTGEGIARVDPRVSEHEDALKKHRPDMLLTGLLVPSQHDLVLTGAGVHRDVRPLGMRRAELALSSRMDTHVTDWNKLARLVFAGKGSPEACQVVLQLADSWGLAVPDVQAYADSALGLDCNGFVGNYLWHVKDRNPWTNLGAGDHDLGPDSPIRTGYYDHYQHRLLDRWESFDTAKMYIMMEVGKDGVVINGGGGAADAGHIVITEPNQRNNRPGKDPKTSSFAVKSVEATGGHTPEGLWESWYTCPNYDSKTKIFSIFRESMDVGHKDMKVKIAAVS